MSENPLSTDELIVRLKHLEALEIKNAEKRHALNNAIQVALFSLNKAQAASLDHASSFTELLGSISRNVSQLSATIFGPNGDNGLRGKVSDTEEALKTINKSIEDFKDEINKSLSDMQEKWQQDSKNLWIKLAGVAATATTVSSIVFYILQNK